MSETEIQRMVVRMVGDASSYQRMTKDVVRTSADLSRGVKTSQKDVEGFGKTIDQLGSKMSAAAGQFRAMTALESPSQIIRDAIRLSGQSETSTIEFGTLLKDDGKGADLVQQIQRFAADTPLAAAGIEKVARTLLQFQVAQKDLLPTMKMLGDAAGGSQDKFQRLALAFGQMRGTGKVTNEELNQMREAGFYPLAEMAKIVGKDVGVMKDEIAKGAVPFAVFERALRDATRAGGQFYNGMERTAKGLEGLFSTMNDDLDAAKRTIGEFVVEWFRLKDAMKGVSAAAQGFTQWFRDLSPLMKTSLVSVVLFAASFGSLIVTWKIGSSALGMIVANLNHMRNTFVWIVQLGGMVGKMFLSLLNPVVLLTNALSVLRVLVATVFGPWSLALMAVTVLVSALIERAGGLEAVFSQAGGTAREAWETVSAFALRAWDAVKAAALRFWAWFAPYWDVLQSVALRVWDEVSRLAGMAWEFVSSAALTAFTYIQERAAALVEFLAPVWTALTFLAAEVWVQAQHWATVYWEYVKGAAQSVWEVIKEVGAAVLATSNAMLLWNLAAGNTVVTWEQIRDAVVFAIHTAEFMIKNFRQIWDLAVTGAQYQFVRLQNTVAYFFGDVLPAALSWFGTNWSKVFTDVVNWTVQAWKNMSLAMIRAMVSVTDVISGKMKVEDFVKIFDGVIPAWNSTVDQLVIPPRVPDAIENALGNAIEDAQLKIATDFVKFMTERMFGGAPVVPPQEAIEVFVPTVGIVEEAEEAAAAVARIAVKPAEKFDAALFKSAEAMTRIANFRDANRANPENRGRDFQSEAAKKAEQDRIARQQLKETQAVRRAVEASNNRPAINILPANFGG